jgi:hypothetical protein
MANKQANSFLKEYTDPGYSVQNQIVRVPQLVNLIWEIKLTKMILCPRRMYIIEILVKAMINFNNSFIKQKELIPKYCKKPLEREFVQSAGSSVPDFDKMNNGGYISMYTMCKIWKTFLNNNTTSSSTQKIIFNTSKKCLNTKKNLLYNQKNNNYP